MNNKITAEYLISRFENTRNELLGDINLAINSMWESLKEINLDDKDSWDKQHLIDDMGVVINNIDELVRLEKTIEAETAGFENFIYLIESRDY